MNTVTLVRRSRERERTRNNPINTFGKVHIVDSPTCYLQVQSVIKILMQRMLKMSYNLYSLG